MWAMPHAPLPLASVCVVLALGACVAPVEAPGAACGGDRRCGAGLVCQGGICARACDGDADCGGDRCDATAGACVGCLEDADCPADQFCNSFTKSCERRLVGCETDPGCATGRCDGSKGVCVGCLSDADCAADARCDLVEAACVSAAPCASSPDCDDGRVCSPAGRCVECVVGGDCPSGRCDAITSTCALGCIDADPSEPNQGAAALALALPAVGSVEHAGTICPGDIDEVRIDASALPPGAAVSVSVSSGALTSEGGGPLRLWLLDATGALVQEAPWDQSGLAVRATAGEDLTVAVRVAGFTSTTTADYVLRAAPGDGPPCVQLDDEPNDDVLQARPATPDGPVSAGAICGGDVDVFRFDVPAIVDVEVGAVPGDGVGTLRVDVLDASGGLLASGNPAVVPGASGRLYARVRATGGDATYSLRVATSQAACTQSDAEPNDGASQALTLAPGTPALGSICPGDLDRYRFAAAAGDDASIVLEGTGLRARLVRLSDGVTVATGSALQVADLTAGGYAILVDGPTSTARGSYSVVVRLTPEPAPIPARRAASSRTARETSGPSASTARRGPAASAPATPTTSRSTSRSPRTSWCAPASTTPPATWTWSSSTPPAAARGSSSGRRSG
jgi:hypothetical protein